MKKFAAISLLSMTLFSVACSKSDDTPDPDDNGGGQNGGTEIRGTITTDQHWTKDKVYRLRGYVYVTNNATLKIDAGTKIVSNKDSAGVLMIYRGAKIMAEGTASEPIVFTSNESSPQPGDLGGVIIVGQATGNGNHSVVEGGVDAAFSAFGGTNDADNSGVLKYVRIEYAGKAVNPGDEVNGLSLYGVGSGTTIDYVQVVRGLDDAFEFFGGTVNCKHLIAYNCADDDFDMDDGYRGKIQYGISVKNPTFTDAKGTSGDVSNNFEVDNVNPSNGFLLTRAPITSPTLSNFTLIGPNGASGTSTDYGWNMRWRRGAKFVFSNSVVLGGQKGGARVQEDSTIYYYATGTSAFYNNLLNAVTNPIDVQTGLALKGGLTYDLTSITTLTTGDYKSTILAAAADAGLTDPFNNAAPNLKPASGSPALAGALFDFGTLGADFFDKVSFRGALDGTNDWTSGWAVWGK
ncbi:MAG: hypothetical protein J7497_11825 [Chitinophagaceae bacterium]|nr:hypothetical protein [Chitinophagaceae bacterium]